MRFKRSFLSAVVLGAWLVAPAAGAVPILALDQERSVLADADAISGNQSSLQRNEDGTSSFDPFVSAVSASGVTDDVNTSASGNQSSIIGGSSVFGSGGATASGQAASSDGLGIAVGESFFSLTFQVDETLPFLLSGSLSAFVASVGDGDGFASLELTAPGGGLTLFSSEVSFQELDSFSIGGTLTAGVEYELTAIASASALADEISPFASGSSGFNFELVIVPEPGTLVLLVSGLGGLALVGRRRS